MKPSHFTDEETESQRGGITWHAQGGRNGDKLVDSSYVWEECQQWLDRLWGVRRERKV